VVGVVDVVNWGRRVRLLTRLCSIPDASSCRLEWRVGVELDEMNRSDVMCWNAQWRGFYSVKSKVSIRHIRNTEQATHLEVS